MSKKKNTVRQLECLARSGAIVVSAAIDLEKTLVIIDYMPPDLDIRIRSSAGIAEA